MNGWRPSLRVLLLMLVSTVGIALSTSAEGAPVEPVADLVLTHTGPATMILGLPFTSTLTVTNAGPSAMSGAVLDVQRSNLASRLSVAGACTFLPCTLPELAPDESRTVVVTFVVGQQCQCPSPLMLTGTVSAGPGDPDPANNVATLAVALTSVADISIRVSGPLVAPVSGGRLWYSFTISNAGPSAADNVTVDIPTPPGLAVELITGCLTVFPCSLGTVTVGFPRLVSVLFQAPSGYRTPNPIVSAATVTTSTFDPMPTNNTASMRTFIPRRGCDMDNFGPQEIVTGAGPGGGPHVLAWSWNYAHGSMESVASFYAYEPSFAGGVFVACEDVDGDGFADIVTGAGPGGGPHVRAFSVAGGLREIAGFFAYDPAFAGGVAVATGDVNGDGVAEIITGAGAGGGPHVRVLSARGGVTELAGFFSGDPSFAGGVWVAAGDLDGDGFDEIVTGAGPGGLPYVRVFRMLPGGGVVEVASFLAYEAVFHGGVHVAVGDVNGDGIEEIITGPGPGGGPHVRVFAVADGNPTELAGFYAYDPAYSGGVFVAASAMGDPGRSAIITGTNQSDGPLRTFWLTDYGVQSDRYPSFFPYFSLFGGPVHVASADVPGEHAGQANIGMNIQGGVVRPVPAGRIVTEVATSVAVPPVPVSDSHPLAHAPGTSSFLPRRFARVTNSSGRVVPVHAAVASSMWVELSRGRWPHQPNVHAPPMVCLDGCRDAMAAGSGP
jgi:hypothetical protein